MSDNKPKIFLLGLVGVFVVVVAISHYGARLNIFSDKAAVSRALQSTVELEKKPGVYCAKDVAGKVTWCEDLSESLSGKKTVYDYGAAVAAVKNAGVPQYTSKKNKDNSTSFYINGRLAVGDSGPGPCKMFNPNPEDTSTGTHIQSDSPACATPGVSYSTVTNISESAKP